VLIRIDFFESGMVEGGRRGALRASHGDEKEGAGRRPSLYADQLNELGINVLAGNQ
jgi:hypothetical protein